MSLKVRSYKFDKSAMGVLDALRTGKNWPVVYVLEDSTEAYVGETTSARRRLGDHLDNPEREHHKNFHVIEHEMFNKSATLDIESMLIEYVAADDVFRLQNGNAGLRNHNYFNKQFYQELFRDIWDELTAKGLAKHSLRDIANTDLFKYSPYKRLTEDQAGIVEELERTIGSGVDSISVINGEPGSGKTILAIYLVKLLLSETQLPPLRVGIVLPQTSLRETVKKIFRHVKGLKPSMVLGPNDVANATERFDVLIVDESHRLTQRRNLANYSTFDDACRKLGIDPIESSQVDWILQRCRHAVFLYDPKQTVKPSDVDKGVFERLKTRARSFTLTSQLRVMAGEGYSLYLDEILRNQARERLSFPGYDLRLFDRLGDMVGAIKLLDQEFGLCRVVAGYAWDWVSREDASLDDIRIQDQRLRWNSTVKDWINSPNSIHEIGCIHTVQGYDLNYVGVIIGPELTYENSSIVFHADRYKDRYGKHSSLSDEALFNYIANIYKTLMTRGIRGTYIFACDPGLAHHLSDFFPADGHDASMVAEPKTDYEA